MWLFTFKFCFFIRLTGFISNKPRFYLKIIKLIFSKLRIKYNLFFYSCKTYGIKY